MEHRRKTGGKHVGNPRVIVGTPMGDRQKTDGKVWKTVGEQMENRWETDGTQTENIWKPMESRWDIDRKPAGNRQKSSGNH